MNDKSKLSDLNQVSARRRLIRGAFSVPAVLALHTGSAMATTSPMRCIKPTNLTPTPSDLSNESFGGSVWVRTQLWFSTADHKYYMFGTNLPAALRKTGTMPAVGAYHEFNVTTNVMSSSATASTPSHLTQQTNPKWVVIRFDSQGMIETVGHATQGTAVTASCWSSFYKP